MAHDKLSVVNMALLKTALPLAASLDDFDYNIGLVFENVATEALRTHAWNFARRFRQLEASALGAVSGYKHAYFLPQDAALIIDVRAENDIRAPKGRFETDGNLVYCNCSPCYARYVRLELDPARWTADFANAVASRIAAEIAGLSAEKIAMIPQLMQLYDYWLARAMANDAREQTERVPLDDSLYAMRSGNEK